MGELSGTVALVTGVSRRVGIGYTLARQLAAAGADVLAAGWAAHDAEMPWGEDAVGTAGITDGLPADAGHVVAVDVDLADPAAPAVLMERARVAFGPVRVLVAAHARSSSQDLATTTAAELDLSFAVNVRAALLLVQAFAAQPVVPAAGRVVTFTSGQHLGPMPGELPYVASKGAVQQVTATLAAELAPQGVTVNCVDPGPTDTGYADEEDRRALAGRHPRGRWGSPDDVAHLVAWLVDPRTEWVTGQTLVSDGGWSLRGHGATRGA